MEKNSKRDHYLPQFYLNFFCAEADPRVFWVYDKKGGGPKCQTPINTGIEGQLYRLEGPRITNPKFIDTTLFQRSESAVKPLMHRLLSSGARLKDDDIPELANFLALMHIRVPRTQKMVKEVGGVAATHLLRETSKNTAKMEEILRRCREENVKDDMPSSAEEFRELLERVQEKYNIELTKQPALLLSVLSVTTIVQQLLEMNWCLCRSPKDAFFITSDAPVVIFLLDDKGEASFGQGLVESAVEVSFPLSPMKCLYLRRRRIQKYWPMNKENVREVNRRSAFMAERFLISSRRTNEISELAKDSSITLGRPKVDKKTLLEQMEAESNTRLKEELR